MPARTESNTSLVLEKLQRLEKNEYGDEYNSSVLEIYKLYVEMADRVSQRRQNANSFYLSINTIFLGSFALFGGAKTGLFEVFLICVAGIALCVMWCQNIQTYKDLNSGKFSIINTIESLLPLAPYDCEWEMLERGTDSKKYRPFHRVESVIPWIFGGVYFLLLARSVISLCL